MIVAAPIGWMNTGLPLVLLVGAAIVLPRVLARRDTASHLAVIGDGIGDIVVYLLILAATAMSGLAIYILILVGTVKLGWSDKLWNDIKDIRQIIWRKQDASGESAG